MTHATRTQAARTALLDAAEAIAGERGLGAITLTAVQQRAGQANKSAAAYHFGSRDGLLSAVVERRMRPVDRERRALLDALGPDCADVAALTAALVRPLAHATAEAEDSYYARFLAQAFIDPALGRLVLGNPEATSFRDVRRQLDRALAPQVGEELAASRVVSAVGLLITSCALRHSHPEPLQAAVFVDDLVATCLAVLTAPTPAPSTDPAQPRRDP